MLINIIGIVVFFGMNIVNWVYIRQDKQWPSAALIVFGLIRPVLSIVGFILILLPLLLSQSDILRKFFKIKTFRLIS